MIAMLAESPRVAGYKQTIRAIKQGRALRVFCADDAEPAICEAVLTAAAEAEVPVEKTTMRELGRACGIDVPTAAAAVTAPKEKNAQ